MITQGDDGYWRIVGFPDRFATRGEAEEFLIELERQEEDRKRRDRPRM